MTPDRQSTLIDVAPECRVAPRASVTMCRVFSERVEASPERPLHRCHKGGCMQCSKSLQRRQEEDVSRTQGAVNRTSTECFRKAWEHPPNILMCGVANTPPLAHYKIISRRRKRYKYRVRACWDCSQAPANQTSTEFFREMCKHLPNGL